MPSVFLCWRYLITNKYFVICINTLGSCFGSTSPVSVNKKTGKPYRLTFPELTVEDMANASFMLLKKLGINKEVIKRGDFSDLYTQSRQWTDKERQK